MSVIRAPRSLGRFFGIGVTVAVVYLAVTVSPEDPRLVAAACLVGILSVFPAWLWSTGRVFGLPLFPILAMTYVPTYALPLLDPPREAAVYSVEQRLTAAGAVCLFQLVATLVWYPLARRPSTPLVCWGFRGTRNSLFFLFFIACGDAYMICANAGWLPEGLPPGAYSILRSVTIGLAGLGVAVLAYRCGTRSLSGESQFAFFLLFGILMTAMAVSLTIIGSVSSFLMAIAMFSLGRGRLPLLAIVLAGMVFSVLHAGKHPMRATYWYSSRVITPADYPEFYANWAAIGFNSLLPGAIEDRKIVKSVSLAERSSLLQMMLMAMKKTDEDKPFLMGRTYEIVPELLIPRILLEDKVLAHEGTTILNVHFGRQTRKQTLRTTIGYGHLAEAYANFGWLGVIGLGVITGSFVGAVTRWSAGVPIDSFRGLVGLMFLGMCIQTEHTVGVTAASLTQGLQLLFVLGLVLMEPRRNELTP